MCEAAGLIWGQEVLADVTRVPGNAAMDLLVPRLKAVVDDHIAELFDGGSEPIDEMVDHDGPESGTAGSDE